ncbi:PAS domain S-box protein, partial [Mariprofundus sp. EBB-1]|uniref:PAS domain S-box protein n=1 Tax=Mariprofundus sp. EBB-1 TaxID=2650971 RepID=UPI000EF2257B
EYVNPAYTELTGYSAEESVGCMLNVLKRGVLDSDSYENIKKAVSTQSDWSGKIIDKKKDGRSYPATMSISPIHELSKDVSEASSHFVCIQSDLTNVESLEQQFYQAQKMEALGVLVGGVAHNFNNMLAAITGNLYLAKTRAHSHVEAISFIDDAESTSFQAAEMVKQLMTYARKDRVQMKTINLN